MNKMNKKNYYGLPKGRTTLILFLLICSVTNQLNGQQNNDYVDSIIVHKTFPLISYLKQSPEVLKTLQKDKVLKRLTLNRKSRVETAIKECEDMSCYVSPLQWQNTEIVTIGTELIKLFYKSEPFRQAISLLKESGYYNVYASMHDTAFIRTVWNSTATGINNILDVYIMGKRPRYPASDAASFAANDSGFRLSVRQILENVLNSKHIELFYEMPLNVALQTMRLNQRDEASRYEPLNGGMNLSAFENIRKIKWASYPYSVILVPGKGPERDGVIIDSMSIYRCKQAAKSYKEKLAPFIIVSGGHVHPNKTPYSEAVEMKKYMTSQLNIPEHAIFIEPHARHTTTNLRNAVRMIYRFNIPDNKKILIVTDSGQNALIQMMEKRCLSELGYVPFRELKRLSEETSAFYPVATALQCNSLDPLDP